MSFDFLICSYFRITHFITINVIKYARNNQNNSYRKTINLY